MATPSKASFSTNVGGDNVLDSALGWNSNSDDWVVTLSAVGTIMGGVVSR